MSQDVKLNTATKLTFAVKDEFGALKSGLLNAAFTKTLRDESGASAVSVTVTERGSTGVYDAILTPDALGCWYLLVEHSSYGKWGSPFRVTTRGTDDLAYPATSGRSLAVSAAGAVDALLAAGAITTASFAAGAIDAAAIAADAIGASELAADAVAEIAAAVAAGSVASVVGAVGSVTGAVGSVTGAVGSVTAAVTVGTINANVITATSIAADAIDSDALAASAVSEIAAAISSPSAATIAAAVADEALAGHTTAGTLGEALLRLRGEVLHAGTLQADGTLAATASSDDYAYRNGTLVLVSGPGAGKFTTIQSYNGTTKVYTQRSNFVGTSPDNTTTYVILAAPIYLSQANVASMDGDVIGASQIAANAIGASELAADAVAEIAAAISVPSAATVADAVWDEAKAGHVAAGSFGERVPADVTTWAGDSVNALATGNVQARVISVANNAITANAIATDAIDADALAADAVAEIQASVTANPVASVTGAVGSVTGSVGSVTGAVGSVTGNVGGSVASVVGAVGSVTAGVTLGTGSVTDTAIHATGGNKIADHVLRRSLASAAASSFGDAVSFRSLLGAARKLVNRVRLAAGLLEVYDETDTGTPAGTQTATTDAAADPVTELDT